MLGQAKPIACCQQGLQCAAKNKNKTKLVRENNFVQQWGLQHKS
jgi:hypothetical protein